MMEGFARGQRPNCQINDPSAGVVPSLVTLLSTARIQDGKGGREGGREGEQGRLPLLRCCSCHFKKKEGGRKVERGGKGYELLVVFIICLILTPGPTSICKDKGSSSQEEVNKMSPKAFLIHDAESLYQRLTKDEGGPSLPPSLPPSPGACFLVEESFHGNRTVEYGEEGRREGGREGGKREDRCM